LSQLVAQNLSKSYGKRKIIESASVSLQTGEVVGLLGPNGAGKTTCFYMIVGLVRCDSGTILLDGQDITSLPIHQRARLGIGYLPQEASIFRKMSVSDNILSILETRSDLTPHQRHAKLESLLEDLSIAHIRDQIGINLSGGERRRAEIARALATDPKFIFLDEPFAGVDPISVGEIQQIVSHLVSRNIGVLITDHNVRETLGICHRAYILNQGYVITEGMPDEILAHPTVRQVYLGEQFKL
jgi:lipopolysaccharide export system ATP-binding protein